MQHADADEVEVGGVGVVLLGLRAQLQDGLQALLRHRRGLLGWHGRIEAVPWRPSCSGIPGARRPGPWREPVRADARRPSPPTRRGARETDQRQPNKAPSYRDHSVLLRLAGGGRLRPQPTLSLGGKGARAEPSHYAGQGRVRDRENGSGMSIEGGKPPAEVRAVRRCARRRRSFRGASPSPGTPV